MKKCLQNMNVESKTVIVRVDYNVTISNGVILDDSKMKETLETLFYLLKQNCKIVLLSHLGKVKTEEDKAFYSLEGVASHLSELLGRDVYFSKENFGNSVIERVKHMKPQEILMLENTRFLDVPNKLESKCDAQLSMFWASLGDVFVNDAFATSHRKHASTYGISKYLPSCIGFLMQKEIGMLDRLVLHPAHPFTVIMGGAKIDDKLSLISSLLLQCDHLLLGGGLANTCLDILGFQTGESLVCEDAMIREQVKDMLLQYKDKIVLPLDVIVGSTYDKNYVQYKLITQVQDNEMIFDIGVKTLEKYQSILKDSQTIFLNGTVGMYENRKFANGTKELLRLLSTESAIVVLGGGDAGASAHAFGYDDSFTYISSGGGATLEYLVNGSLLALENIEEEGEQIETLDM